MKTFKRIIDISSTVALVVFVILVVFLVGIRLLGLEPHIVLSGSMEPEIMTGSMAYISRLSPEEAKELQAGDVVTYIVDERGTKVTHKIYEVVGPAYVKNQYGEYVLDENGQPTVARDEFGNPIIMYTTYGINNKNPSDPSGYTLDGTPGVGNLASSNIFGKPVLVIPFLGYITHFVQNPPGRYIVVIICAFLVINTFFSGLPKKEKKDENAPEESSEAQLDTPNAEGNEPTEPQTTEPQNSEAQNNEE